MRSNQPTDDHPHTGSLPELDRTGPFLGGTESTTAVPGSDTDGGSDDTGIPAGVPEQVARFVIRHRLGQGGFGAVYLAHDPLLDRDIALKLPGEGSRWSELASKSFLDEARTAARLKHPHVVTIYDVGLCERHGVFIAMEYVAGETLASRLQRGKLSVPEAVRICGQVADAIQHGHKQGLVHRDLKPANILLDRDGNAKVCDFGLALGEDARSARRGDASGTRPYMSPEQLRGECHLLDGRSDLWSLGIILYECLSGRRPFHGDSLTEMQEDIRSRQPTPLPQYDEAIPLALDDLFRHCTQRDVTKRLRTALEFKQGLVRAAQTKRLLSRRGAWVVTAAAVFVAAAAALTVRGLILSPAEDQANATSPPRKALRLPPLPPAPVVADGANKGTKELRIRQLRWPSWSDADRWEILPVSGALRVRCDEQALLAFDGLAAVDYDLQVDIYRPEWNQAKIGLFYGYKTGIIDGGIETRYRTIVLSRLSPQSPIELMPYSHRLSKTQTELCGTGFGTTVVIPPGDASHRLSIKVRKSLLTAVQINGRDLSEDLTENWLRSPIDPEGASWFGVCVQGGSADFMNVTVDGQRYSLLDH